MSNKKNIDRLFQEKFKNFEATPSDSVWKNISSELKNIDQGKKGTPIWWKAAGVAAALLLLFTVSQFVFNNNTTIPLEEIIVDVDSQKNILNNDVNKVSDIENTISDLDVINTNVKVQSKSSETNAVITHSQIENVDKNVIVSNKLKKRNKSTSNVNKNELVVSSEDKTKNSIVNNSPKTDATSKVDKNGLVVASTNQTKSTVVDNTISNLPKKNTSSNDIDKTKIDASNYSQQNNSSETKETLKTSLAYETVEENTTESEKANEIKEENKLSLTEKIAANEEDVIIDEDEEEFERWKVASFIAPVYFNTFGGEGSSIHPQFNNNSKSGDINISYGISGSYAINKKLSVRSGINKVKLGYSTNDVIVYNNIGGSGGGGLLRNNIELTESAQNLLFISANEFNFAQVPGIFTNFIESSIDQKLGFIEIPLEFEYKISDKKMGINIIGGFSALFLNENEVYSVLDGNSTLLGKATNINSTSFSANFGLGFDFKISDKFNFNLEPVFKYQLNTFNNTSGDFNPYFIGVYSGLSFKF